MYGVAQKKGVIFGCIYLVFGVVALILYIVNAEIFFIPYIPFIVLLCCFGVIFLLLAFFNKSPTFNFSKSGLIAGIIGFLFMGTSFTVGSAISPILFSYFLFIGIFFFSFAGFYMWLYFQKGTVKNSKKKSQ